jgi:hypothetical protein
MLQENRSKVNRINISMLELTLYNLCQAPHSFYSANHFYVVQIEISSDSRLCLQITPELYNYLNNNEFFNLKPEFRIYLTNDDFHPDRPIQLELTLHPDLLPQLLDHAQNAEEAAAYLQTLSQQQTEQRQSTTGQEQSAENNQNPEAFIHPLLYTENWFCLSVKQQQDSGEVGYNTLWNYVNPAVLNQPGTSSDQIAEAITRFVADWTASNLTAATQDITEELFKGVTTLFDGFDTWLDKTFPTNDTDDLDDSTDDETILETVIDFFSKDDWAFTKLQGQSILHITYQGNHGLWNCYAQARESQEQFVFYSIYPEIAPEEKRLTVAEYLTRANYGLIIGNFELDFNDGEIRYKTSIDIEGDLLTEDLVKQLVYANVMMMDEYFPGIQSVINGNLTPLEAIQQIENQFVSSPNSDLP